MGPSVLPRARGSDSACPLRLLRAPIAVARVARRSRVLEETQETEEIIQRIAALDIGKAQLTCCIRVPGAGAGGCRRSRPTRR